MIVRLTRRGRYKQDRDSLSKLIQLQFGTSTLDPPFLLTSPYRSSLQ